MKIFKTTAEVITALGGIDYLAEMSSISPNAVYNWRADRQFPADTYRLIKDELAEIGADAPDYLWPMRVAPKKRKKR